MNIGNVIKKVFSFASRSRNFALIAGVVLFLIGVIGFAFRSDRSLSDVYLLGALVLGFWGIVSGLWDNSKTAE